MQHEWLTEWWCSEYSHGGISFLNPSSLSIHSLISRYRSAARAGIWCSGNWLQSCRMFKDHIFFFICSSTSSPGLEHECNLKAFWPWITDTCSQYHMMKDWSCCEGGVTRILPMRNALPWQAWIHMTWVLRGSRASPIGQHMIPWERWFEIENWVLGSQ